MEHHKEEFKVSKWLKIVIPIFALVNIIQIFPLVFSFSEAANLLGGNFIVFSVIILTLINILFLGMLFLGKKIGFYGFIISQISLSILGFSSGIYGFEEGVVRPVVLMVLIYTGVKLK